MNNCIKFPNVDETYDNFERVPTKQSDVRPSTFTGPVYIYSTKQRTHNLCAKANEAGVMYVRIELDEYNIAIINVWNERW